MGLALTLSVLLEMAASGHGDRIALGTAADGITFTALADLAARGAHVLSSRPIRHTVLLGRNGPVMPHLLFASALAGIAFTPINYRLGATQVHEMLAELRDPLVVADEEYLTIVDKSYPSMSTADFAAAAAQAEPAPPLDVDDDSAAVMLFTSGTTTRQPKVVPLRHGNLFSYILSTVEFGATADDESALVTVPPYHVAAVASVLSNLYAGRRVVYLPDFDAGAWLALVRAEQVTSAMVVPTMLSRIVEHLSASGTTDADVPSLRVVSYGGARMPRPVLERALAAFPAAGFVNAYGLTETSSTIALLSPDDHRRALASDDREVRSRLSSAGRAVPGIEMQVRDDNGDPLGPNEVGELWVRGPQVSGEYVGVGSVLDADGWFPTKDRARLDDEGYLFIEGRVDDIIIRGGENIAPAEIEDVLAGHPAVLDAAVIGVPDDEWGERLVAAVVRRGDQEVTEDDLRSWCRARLRGSRTPDAVVWCDELPHTATGKLLRRELVATITDTPHEQSPITDSAFWRTQ